MATWATEVEESPQAGGQAGEMGSPPVIQMDERETRLTKSFAQQPSISAGCMPVLCCLLGHDVFFSRSLLLESCKWAKKIQGEAFFPFCNNNATWKEATEETKEKRGK